MKKALFVLAFATASSFGFAQASDLLFSVIAEDGGSKVFEIYNATGSTIDLSNYSVALYSNANGNLSSPNSSVTLSGNLPDGGEYVIGSSTSDTENPGDVDLVSGGVANFNGNDALIIWFGSPGTGTVVDSVGQAGSSIVFNESDLLVRQGGNFTADTDPTDAFSVTDNYTVSSYSGGSVAELKDGFLPVELDAFMID